MNNQYKSFKDIFEGKVGEESNMRYGRVRSVRKVSPQKGTSKSSESSSINSGRNQLKTGASPSRVPRRPRRRLTLTAANVERVVTNDKLVKFEARQEEEHKKNIEDIKKRQESSKQKLMARLANRDKLRLQKKTEPGKSVGEI